ncbi:MAG: hypothetical protein II982_04320, partial [Clostridia bacterium]|nr:hypothetical protein [Clostridia bacterium]
GFFGGAEFKFENEDGAVEFEITNDEIKVGYNQTVKDKDLSEMNKSLKDWLEKKNQAVSSAKLSFNVGGYVVVKVGNNTINKVTGQVILSLKYKNDIGRTVFVLVPVRVGVEFSIEGKLIITAIGYDFENAKFIFPELDGKIKGTVTALAGIGCSVASVGVYGSAALELALNILPQFMVDSLILSGEFGVYAKAVFLGEAKLPIVSGDLVLYDKDRADLSAYSLYDTSSVYNDTSSVYNEMMYSLERSSASAWNSSVVDGILQTNVSGFADPVTVKADDSIVSVYLSDDVTLDEHNSQQLVYSVFNGSGWSEPVSVDTNRLADGEYSLYSDGNTIYLAYTEAKRILTSDDDATAKASAIEVVVCKFDSTNKIFTEHTVITNDTYFDTQPAISVVNGMPTVAFVKNTDNNIFGMSENNALYVCQYIDGEWVTATVSTKTNAVTSLALGSFDGQNSVVASICDSDNNFETTEDRYVSLYTLDGQNVSTAIGSYDNAVFEGNTLYWYNSNAVYKTNSFSNTGTLVTDAISQDFAPDFDVLSDGSLLFRVYNAENENGGADLYVVKGNTLPVRITETGGYIDSFDALTVDRSILTLCRTTEVTYFDEYGFETVSNLESKYIEDFEKLEVSDIYYSDLDLFGDDTLTLTISVTNSGTLDANGFTLNVNGVSTAYTDILRSGETKDIEYIYTYPETPSDITVNVDNSEKSISVGYADFVVN